ncbi:4-hydroxythreonine-4-phosphate dehydrogenase [Gluconobacter sp. R75690]|uniref:4-hydroxythreonine-4-phosphate dehydrogenase n=1 Tax=Gluconobacter TaxID=441 RepID=UPI00188BC508|nr:MULTISPECIES: 4-hydroxythreonine-4-phosphate dehydrogenase [unclassified Gluconobacter]MBF0849647.1 4-hydroxythreonine-4-phosphate dehydrogenase [Gluconobacter sp. R75690]MBF0878124.1 4-hydroxythreonine-4-phosphate dehydrogenase [Gluconobacter sp. R75828]
MSRPEFIFMLTRHDRTVENAADLVETARVAGVRHIGFKDIGLPFAELQTLTSTIRGAGAKTYLEVVSLDRDSELRSIQAGIALGVDYLLGGTHVDEALKLLEGTSIRYYPFPGRISGHPSLLEGTETEIVRSAVDLVGRPGVHGLDLLAYRFVGNVPKLIRQVCAAVSNKPVIVAGSLDRTERIRATASAGAAGFTIGTALLDGAFPALPDLAQQIGYVQTIVRQL